MHTFTCCGQLHVGRSLARRPRSNMVNRPSLHSLFLDLLLLGLAARPHCIIGTLPLTTGPTGPERGSEPTA